MADEPLSPEEIDAIRERERNATGGDWRLEPNRDGAEILIGGVEYAGPRGWYYWLATGHCTAEQPRADGEFITKARRDVPRLLATVDALREERDRLAMQVYVPGLWRCARCEFQLVQANLNARDGSVTARDEPGDKCPNCNAPLWRVTEREAGSEMVRRCEEQVGRAITAEARADAAEAERDRLAKDMAKAGAHLEAGLKALEAAGVVCSSGDRALEIIRAALNPVAATQAPAADARDKAIAAAARLLINANGHYMNAEDMFVLRGYLEDCGALDAEER